MIDLLKQSEGSAKIH